MGDGSDGGDGGGLVPQVVRDALRSPDPTAFTVLVSSALSATREWDPDGGSLPAGGWDTDDEEPDEDDLSVDDLVTSFLSVSYAETTAALHVIAAMLPDELDATRLRRALAERHHPLPDHVTGVRDIVVTRAAHLGDELGDGDNLILGLEWPGTRGVTAVVYVDESFGTRVKDVFLVPEPFDVVVDQYRAITEEEGDPRSALVAIDPADARASLRLAIDRGDAPDAPAVPEDWTGPDGEPLGWPAARPFLEMLLRRMPPGGSPVLTSAGLPELSPTEAVEAFLASPESAGVRDLPDADAAAALIATDMAEAGGHPLRLSPVQVEIALTQRLPWAAGASDAVLDRVGDVLPAYVRFAHARLGVAEPGTSETLAVVAACRDVFDALRHSAAVADWREVAPLIDAFEHGDPSPLVLHTLAREVGGADALDRLDTDPLPDEPLDTARVPADVRDGVAAVGAAIDRWLETSPRVEALGPVRDEWRTAARRLLVGAAVRDPGCVRRRASVEGRACGVLWATGVENHLVGPGGVLLVKDLAADFGVRGAPSAKAATMLAAWTDGRWAEGGSLGDPGLLVSTRRAEIIEARDRYRT
ncbi:hypothetical protein GCM10023168_05990 [Fodinibacter luteus]|uniref:Uncharacterized protein n=1 Tax=Fodinibacter luteus TaxID=552064 RepID=A0ABP8K267_9MICO